MVNNPELGAMIFGLLSAITFGAGDFSGGFASRRTPVVGVITISHAVGLVLLIVLALASGEALPASADMLWGAAAGASGMVGLGALYRALAIGRAGIVAPIVGVIGAVLPVGFAFVTTGLPEILQLLGLVLGLISVWLVSGAMGTTSRESLGLAVLAGLAFGVFFTCYAQVSVEAFFWPLVAARFTSFSIMLLVALFSRREWFPRDRRALWVIVLAGLLDVSGNATFIRAAQTGHLDIAAVVSSLYPAVTILLARFVLKEILTLVQFIGVVTALVAITLIAAG